MSWRERFQARGLQAKFLLFIVALALIPGILLGMLLSDVAQRTMRQTLLRDYNELARQCADDVTLFLKETRQTVQRYAKIAGETLGQTERLQWTLNQMVLDAPLFETAYLFDTTGRLLITTTFDTRSIPPLVQALVDQSSSAGHHLLSEVYFSDTGIPRILMGVPIEWQQRRRGVLIAEINLLHLWEVVDRLRIGKTGFVAMYTREGVLIAHPDKARVLEPSRISEVPRRVITADVEVPDVAWTVVVQQNADEAYHFVGLMRWMMGGMILFVLAGALTIAYRFGKPLLDVFRALLDGTTRIARGDFAHPLAVRTRDELGQLTAAFNRMMGTLRDAQQMERQLIQSQKMAEMSLLVASLAHELRNPLNNIATALLRLEHVECSTVPAGNGIHACLQRIRQNLDRSKHLISTLLEFAHPTKEPVRSVDLTTLLDLLLDLLDSEMKRRRVDVIRNYAPALPPVLAHIEVLKQALLNILTNGIEAMPEGGTLTVGLCQKEEAFIITVTDTGPGVPAEVSDSIFLPFVTTKEPGKGTGLGLAIAYSNIQKHGGRLSFTGRSGVGTTFTITLPIENFSVGQSLLTYSTASIYSHR